MNRKAHIAWFGLVLMTLAADSRAQLSPGPLSTPHAEYESPVKCTECHVFGAAKPVFVCSQCHTAIQERVDQKAGFHGGIVDTAREGRDCAECHREHVGRDFELIYWPDGRDNFDHSETGYELTGAHSKQKCRDCHKFDFMDLSRFQGAKVRDPDRTFLGLSPSCGKCHEDEHRGQLSAQCDACHNFDSFEEATKFDHDDSDFPLTGKHVDVECLECHPRDQGYAKYKAPGMTECKSCHKDPHDGAFRLQGCKSCHTSFDWEPRRVAESFDHSQTEFPLVGKHNDVGCRDCHAEAKFAEPLEHEQCLDCHEDEHQGQFDDRLDGGNCAACHTEKGFKPTTFTNEDHEDTEYPLTGKHADVECKECHEPNEKETRYKIPFAACTDCHEDAHKGEFEAEPYGNDCEQCHSVDGFHPSSFTLARHEKTEFPLAGAHVATACNACHTPDDPLGSRATAPFHFDSLNCQQCHEHPHLEQFDLASKAAPATCETYHELNRWRRTKPYDHDRTDFALLGAHRDVACEGCHYRSDGAPGYDDVIFADAPAKCAGCHEDVHDGQFDEGERVHACSTCHTVDDWEPTEFDHNEYSNFKIDGSHERVPCKMCHERVEMINDLAVRIYRGTPRKCESCHGEVR